MAQHTSLRRAILLLLFLVLAAGGILWFRKAAPPQQPSLQGRRYLKVKEGEWLVSTTARTEYVSDRNKLYREYVLKPINLDAKTGKIAGFTVQELDPKSALSDAGLQVGDVVLSLNGKPIDHVDQVVGLADFVSKATSIVAEIRRGEATHTVRVTFVD